MPGAEALVGRAPEIDAISDAIGRPGAGAQVVTIRGEAGIGKTSLWQLAIEHARRGGARVCESRSAQTESSFSFVGLIDLMATVADDELANCLPAPQQRALRSALLRGSESVTAEQAVALATAGAIRGLAAERPLVLAIDDVQWLDESTASVLAFALRRLRDVSVTVITTHRTDELVPDRLAAVMDEVPTLDVDVGPLDADAIRALVRSRVEDPTVAERIVGLAGGNPFFASELSQSADELATRSEPQPLSRLPDSLSAVLRRQADRLDDEVSDAVAIAHALARPTLGFVRAALLAGGRRAEAVDRAIELGVLRRDDRSVRPRHPLVGSAVYGRLADGARAELHHRLAELPIEFEERARHHALSIDGFDTDVARALEQAAVGARRRGAPAAAAELVDLALARTPPEEADAVMRRTFDMALDLYRSGNGDRARQLWQQLADEIPPGPDRARALWHLAHFFGGSSLDDIQVLISKALDDAEGHAELQARLYACLARSHHWSGRVREGLAPAETALRLAADVTDDPDLEAYVAGYTTLVVYHVGDERWRDLFARVERVARDHGDELWVELLPDVWRGNLTLMANDDLREVRDDWLRARAVVEQRGSEEVLAHVLATLCEIECRRGEIDVAERYAHAAVALISTADAHRLHGYGQLCLATVAFYRGDLGEARRRALVALEHDERTGSLPLIVFERSLLTLVELTEDRPAAAVQWAEPIHLRLREHGWARPGVFTFVPDLATALVGVGRPDDAESIVSTHLEAAEREGHRDAIAGALRARAHLLATRGELDEAAVAAERSAALFAELGRPFEEGRSILRLSRIEQRRGRASRSRRLRERAHVRFTAVGCAPWADRALPHTRIRLLGGFEVAIGDEPVIVPPGKPTQLVKLLACSGGRVLAEQAIDVLWPDADLATGRKGLRNTLSRLRAAGADLVDRDGEALTLAGDTRVDATEFSRLADAAGPGTDGMLDDAAARAALAAYRGELLPDDVYEEWTLPWRERLRREHFSLLVAMIDAAQDAGDVDAALRLIEQGIAADPLQPDWYARGAALLEASGRPAAAADMVRRGDVITEELGVVGR